jgi:checkpoint serine/threonine-protein kinase
MTINTKEAMNEVYDLFNQTLTDVTTARSEDGESQVDSDDDDDYLSAGESTGTGRISGAESEYGDETEADFTESKTLDVTAVSIDNTQGSGWSEFTEIKELPQRNEDDEDDEDDKENNENITEEFTTPTSPINSAEDGSHQGFPTMGESERSSHSYRNFPRGQNRLPFMTPIVEKTESSLGALTQAAALADKDKDYFTTKTPSRQKGNTSTIPELEGWSSPFLPNLPDNDNDKENLPQPAMPKFVKPKVPLEKSRSHPYASKDIIPGKVLKGPIIKDAQCNPIDESIHKQILSQIQPPIESYTGYFDCRGETCGKGSEIRKFTKLMKGKGEKTMSLIAPPVLSLPGTSRQYTVRRELGKGAFAPVYLVDSLPATNEDEDEKPAQMGQGEFGVQRNDQEAIKMEEPPSAWEFYIIQQARRRLGSTRSTDSIVNAYEMHLFEDEGYLIEEYRNQGTLLDLVNICRAEGSNGGVMDEQLVMFFTIELFRTVEALHAKGIIHGDIKADNVLVRLNNLANDGAWSSQFSPTGMGSWSEKGITLIDFGRGIDIKAFQPTVQFIADWKTSDADCAEMREMRPWTYQVDYHGLAGVVHSLLYGKYLETITERGATLGAGATKTYRIRESLKRYWQTELWGEVFNLLLNPLMHLGSEEGKKMPVLCGMKQLREKMEGYLEENCEKGAGLKSLLKRMEATIRERKK